VRKAIVLFWLGSLVALAGPRMSRGQASAPANAHSAARAPAQPAIAPAAASIPAGTVITTSNWSQYKDFMPDGMARLWAGENGFRMPDDAQIEVGPTVIHPPPKSYLEATEKYAAQVRLIELPDGGLTLSGYRGGAPFPDPAEPHKGWKILANVWYRYLPYLQVYTRGERCLLSAGAGINCDHFILVHRQLSYLTNPKVADHTPDADGEFFTEWAMVPEPEESRYTASLTISYDDLQRQRDTYIFLPALRRSQPISSRARCSPTPPGSDCALEDYRGGFDSNLTDIKVDFLGVKKIVALLPAHMPSGQLLSDFVIPLGWPKPSWGKWQVRNVNVISVTKLPAYAKGYCYGKRVMYVDQTTSAPLWEDLYDNQMRLWRVYGLFLHAAEVPDLGITDIAGPIVYAFWDVQNAHSTFFMDPSDGQPFYLNEQAPKDYFDLVRYTEPSGLSLIMR
jgi:hypothetical protein